MDPLYDAIKIMLLVFAITIIVEIIIIRVLVKRDEINKKKNKSSHDDR